MELLSVWHLVGSLDWISDTEHSYEVELGMEIRIGMEMEMEIEIGASMRLPPWHLTFDPSIVIEPDLPQHLPYCTFTIWAARMPPSARQCASLRPVNYAATTHGLWPVSESLVDPQATPSKGKPSIPGHEGRRRR